VRQDLVAQALNRRQTYAEQARLPLPIYPLSVAVPAETGLSQFSTWTSPKICVDTSALNKEIKRGSKRRTELTSTETVKRVFHPDSARLLAVVAKYLYPPLDVKRQHPATAF